MKLTNAMKMRCVSHALFDGIIHHFPNPFEFLNEVDVFLNISLIEKKNKFFKGYLTKFFLFQKDAFLIL